MTGNLAGRNIYPALGEGVIRYDGLYRLDWLDWLDGPDRLNGLDRLDRLWVSGDRERLGNKGRLIARGNDRVYRLRRIIVRDIWIRETG